MRYVFGLALAAGMLSASTVSAQDRPLSGTWALNIPQFDPLPSSLNWTLDDAGTTFTGTTSLTLESVLRVDGTMTGRTWFGPVYIADASLTVQLLVPGLPIPIPALPSVKAILIRNGDTLWGFALQSLNGTPLNVYAVRGTRVSP